ncbi:helix-turn-helix transcriptional regulator [Streptomyces rochei]|uniref:helix-turn-helix transcriptional regulator n=1 Tax=Streptomyces rochei TaxID=1928 RepID=UPI0037AB14BB
MTTTEIAAEHGVTRQTVHAHRKKGVFPKPVEGEGSTRPRFRADEVAAFFAANPPTPGKRTDLPAKQQGEPVMAEQTEAPEAMMRYDSAVIGSGQRVGVDVGEPDVPTGRVGLRVGDASGPTSGVTTYLDPAQARELADALTRAADMAEAQGG